MLKDMLSKMKNKMPMKDGKPAADKMEFMDYEESPADESEDMAGMEAAGEAAPAVDLEAVSDDELLAELEKRGLA